MSFRFRIRSLAFSSRIQIRSLVAVKTNSSMFLEVFHQNLHKNIAHRALGHNASGDSLSDLKSYSLLWLS